MPEGIILSRVLSVVCLSHFTKLLKPSCLFVEVSTCQLMIKVQRDIRQLFQGIQEAFVEIRTVYCLDVLENIRKIFQVGLGVQKAYPAVCVVCLRFLVKVAILSSPVNHPSVHWYRFLEDSVK